MEIDDNDGGSGGVGGGGAGDDATATATASTSSSLSVSSEHEVQEQKRQQERRNSIKAVMADDSLTPLEKRRTIQSLMDGRTSRRNSMASQASRRGSMASQASRRGSMASQQADRRGSMASQQADRRGSMASQASRRSSMASQQADRRGSMASQVDRRGSMASTTSFSSVGSQQVYYNTNNEQQLLSSPNNNTVISGDGVGPSHVVMMQIPSEETHPMEGTHVGGNNTTVDYHDHGYYGYEDNAGGGERRDLSSINASEATATQQQQQQQYLSTSETTNPTDGSSDINRKQKQRRATSMPLWSEASSHMAVAPSNFGPGDDGAPANSTSSYSIWDDPIMVNQRMEKSRPPCQHYERNCSIVSPCCGMVFGCRICHDECPVLPLPFAKHPVEYSQHPPTVAEGGEFVGDVCVECPSVNTSTTMMTTTTASDSSTGMTTMVAGGAGGGTGGAMEVPTTQQEEAAAMMTMTSPQQRERAMHWDQANAIGLKQRLEKRRSMPLYTDDDVETHHEIDRFAIDEVICRLCYTRQSSKSDFCITCHTQFGAYHCSCCNLWMSDEEEPYHCDDCGFCRVGGRENFKHCHDCGMCIDVTLFDDHNCKAGKYMSNCPVCQEDLFSSRDASHEMPCGHAIHWHCFKELTSYDTRCPVCKKTAETPEHMAQTWNAMAVGISLQPVPPELARVVTITCNDCEEIQEDRRWHFLGVRCNSCGSFNTNVDRTSLTGREASLYLDELDLLRGVEQRNQNDASMDQS